MSLREEVSKLLLKEAIEPVPREKGNQGLYLRYFTVLKKDRGLRPILYLRGLNEFVTYKKFCILPLFKRGDWLVSLDIQDAYFHISIHPTIGQR